MNAPERPYRSEVFLAEDGENAIRVNDAEAENARLRAQVEAVRALHTVVLGSFTTNLAGDVLSEKRRCSCGSDLPCPTAAALSDEGKP